MTRVAHIKGKYRKSAKNATVYRHSGAIEGIYCHRGILRPQKNQRTKNKWKEM